MKRARLIRGPLSRILFPLYAETCRGLVAALHVELDALAAVAVSGAILVQAYAVFFDLCHVSAIVMERI